jgi:protein-disulfide isomerase
VVKGKRPGNDKRGFYVLLAVVAIAGIATLTYMATRARSSMTYVDSTIAPIANQGHVIGSDSAPVEIVEFADFECPACATFANLTEPDIRTRLVNTGQARFRFIDFPLDMHRNTWAAHLAAWCGGDQGKFWEMHDAIFMNQDRWATEATRNPEKVLQPLAQQVGLDMAQYGSCMETRKFIPQIRANYDEAVRRGIQSTPSFIIGRQVHLGSRSFDEFRQLVAAEIAAAAQRPREGTGPGR